MPHQSRCLDQFEDFCAVTEVVRRGIRVTLTVVDGGGAIVHQASRAGA